MMTPQEVANCTFAKSMMGGYNMASVDDFLDKLTEDYAGLYKENAALKAKLKVTVDKMAEYREEQDAIRTTLLTAQKMASAMMTEAEQNRVIDIIFSCYCRRDMNREIWCAMQDTDGYKIERSAERRLF